MSNESASSLPSNEAMQCVERAYALEEQSELETALQECEAAIRIDPSLADAHNLRGVILEQLNRQEEAMLAYREAVRLNPDLADAQENLQDLEAELKEQEALRSPQVEGKGFGIRAGAYIIDLVTIYLSSYVVGAAGGLLLALVVIAVTTLSGRRFYMSEQPSGCLNYIAGLVLSTLYFTIFEWLYGATFGKLALGMRVVKESGEPCDLRVSLIRALYRLVDGFLFAIPAYTSMKPPLHQRIGDKRAKTLVVGSKESIILKPRAWWWFLVAAGLYLMLATFIAALVVGTALR